MLEGLDDAIEWFANRNPPMPGARRMYYIAYTALRALRDGRNARVEEMTREELIAAIHNLRAANINRGRLIDRLEDENYALRCRLAGGADHAAD